MFGIIVLAVDGSRPSDRAVDYAGRLAKESGSRIVAVHVKEVMAGRAAGPVHVDEEEILNKVRGQIKKLQDDGYGHYPVCVAKTQYSFSTDAQLRAAPVNHVVNVREVRLAAGAEFIVMICGDIMTMPGLPKVPSAVKIDLVDGKVVGLF